MVSTFEADGTRFFANKTWQDYIGTRRMQRSEKVREYLGHYHPDDAPWSMSAWRARMVTGEPFRSSSACGAPMGIPVVLHARVPQRDENGEIVRWYWSARHP